MGVGRDDVSPGADGGWVGEYLGRVEVGEPCCFALL